MKKNIQFLDFAQYIAANWSKDPSTKVGAVIVNPYNRIVSTGYNGFPWSIEDDPDLLEDRDQKMKFMVHAEANALVHAQRDLVDCRMYVTHFPCNHCAGMIAESRVGAILVDNRHPDMGFQRRWKESIISSVKILSHSNLWVVGVDEKLQGGSQYVKDVFD